MDDAEDAKFRLRNTLEAKMRSSFDLVQHTLTTLSKEENLTREQKVLLQAVGRTIAEWHELNHNPNPPMDRDGRREDSGRG